MRTLSLQLGKLLGNGFKARHRRQADPYRASRPTAKKLAATHGIEIEPMKPGFNVWPPKALVEEADPFPGDHYANDWDSVLERVNAYVAAISPVTEQV